MRIERAVFYRDNQYWARVIAEEIVSEFGDLDEYLVSSGISPSGGVHFGNFREIMTQYAVKLELEKMGKKVRFVFVWDDYDAMRKVPAGVDPSFEEHLRKPLSGIPDPDGEFESWAKKFEAKFEGELAELGIDTEFLYQSEVYKAGEYDADMKKALDFREKIARILLSEMSDKGKVARTIIRFLFIRVLLGRILLRFWVMMVRL